MTDAQHPASEAPVQDENQLIAERRDKLKVLAETAQEAADEVRALELARLDALLAALWPQQGEPAVVDRVLRIMERRAKLLGLDAPTRVDAVLDIYEVTIGGRGDDNPA